MFEDFEDIYQLSQNKTSPNDWLLVEIHPTADCLQLHVKMSRLSLSECKANKELWEAAVADCGHDQSTENIVSALFSLLDAGEVFLECNVSSVEELLRTYGNALKGHNLTAGITNSTKLS